MDFTTVIDHTYLKREADEKLHVRDLLLEAKRLRPYSVCVNQDYVEEAFRVLEGSGVKVATVIGFPDGNATSAVEKAKEVESCRANELDMVIPYAAVKKGELDLVKDHIGAVCCASNGRLIKVILETCELTERQIHDSSRIAIEAFQEAGHRHGFLKTSTGFKSGGAKVSDMKIFSEYIGDSYGIKASGGIYDIQWALKLFEATGLKDLNPMRFRIGSSKLLLL